MEDLEEIRVPTTGSGRDEVPVPTKTRQRTLPTAAEAKAKYERRARKQADATNAKLAREEAASSVGPSLQPANPYAAYGYLFQPRL